MKFSFGEFGSTRVNILIGLSITIGTIGGIYLLTKGTKLFSKVAERKPKRKNTDRCNVCFDILDLEDFKSCATCCNCGKSVCRGRKCSVWLPSQAGWECQLCNSSNESRSRASEWVHRQHIDQYYRPMSAAKSELYIPIRDRNGGSRLSVYETQSETPSTICAEQKEKVREYVEEILAKMLKGPLDEVSVGQLFKNKKYIKIFRKYHACLSEQLYFLENSIHRSLEDLPLTGSQSDHEGVSHAKLKRLIEKIIEDVLQLPELIDYSGVPGHSEENLPPYFDAKRYQELLATAVLNKIVDSCNNEKKFDNTTEKTSNTDLDKNHNTVTNKKEQQGYSSSSSIEPRSDSSLTDNIRRSNLISPSDSCENIIQSDELLLSDYLNKHKVPLPELSVDSESASDDYISIATSNGVEGSWEDNWLFKRKKHNHESPAPIGMLVPAPREDVRALIGDKTADEVSDLSEAGSDSEGEDCHMDDAEPDLNPPNERVLNKHVIGGKSTVGLFDELLEQTSLISSSSLQDNEPPYTETKNDFVLGDNGLYEIAEPNINLSRGNVSIKNEAINSMITAQILQHSPTKGIFEPTPTENFDETIILAPPMEFTDNPKNTINEINGNNDAVSDSKIKAEIYGDFFAESPTNELSGAQIITCGKQMLTVTTTNNINKLTIEMPCEKQKMVISKMNSEISEGDTPYHTPPSNTPPEENQNNFSCEPKVVRKSSAIEFLAVVALAPVLALSTAEVNDTILKVTEEAPTYETLDLELLKENYCEKMGTNKGQDSFIKQETEADNFEAVNKVSEISENDNPEKQIHQKENEAEQLSSKVDRKAGMPDESDREMNIQKFTMEDEKITNEIAEDPENKIYESISEDIETLSDKVHIQSSQEIIVPQEILRKENTSTETSTKQSEITLIENEDMGIDAIKRNEQISSEVQKPKANTDEQYSTSVGGAVAKEENKSAQNNTSATTTRGSAQLESSLKEFASVAISSEKRAAFPIPEDKTTPLRFTSQVYVTVEGNETLVDNVTKPIDSASITNLQFPEDCTPPADNTLAKHILTQRKETAVKNVREAESTISGTSTTKDAKSQESPKESVSGTESSEVKRAVSIPKDSTAPSENKLEKSTPVEARESPLQNVTEAIKPQNNISVAGTTNDSKLKESSQKFVILTASSETTTIVSIPQDCTPLSETKIEEKTATEGSESLTKQVTPQSIISNTTTTKDVKPEEFPSESGPVTESSDTTVPITEDSTAPSEPAVKGNVQIEEELMLLPLQNATESIKLQNKNSVTNTSDDAKSATSPKESVVVAENSEIKTTISFLEDFSASSQAKIAKSTPMEVKETPSENGREPVAPQNNISDTNIMDDAKAKESPKEVVVTSKNKTVVSIIEDRAPSSETKVQENTPVVAKKSLLRNMKENIALDNDNSDAQSVSFPENSHTKTILSIPEDITVPSETKVEENIPVEAKETPLKNKTEPPVLQNNISDKTTTGNVKVEESPNASESPAESTGTKTDVSIPADSTFPSQTKVEKNKTIEAKEIPLVDATRKAAPRNDISNTTTTDDVKAEKSLKESVLVVECSETETAVSIPEGSTTPSETKVKERTPVGAKKATLENTIKPTSHQNDIPDTITQYMNAGKFPKETLSIVEYSESKTTVSVLDKNATYSEIKVEEKILKEAKETPLANVTEPATLQHNTDAEEFLKECVSIVENSETKTPAPITEDSTVSSKTQGEESIPAEAKETPLENMIRPAASQKDISNRTIKDDSKVEEFVKEPVSVMQTSENKTAVSILADIYTVSETKVEKCIPVETNETSLGNATEPIAGQNHISNSTTPDDAKPDESLKESVSVVECSETKTAVSIPKDSTTPSDTKEEKNTLIEAIEIPLENATEPATTQNATANDAKVEESPKGSLSFVESLETAVSTPEDSTTPSKDKVDERTPVKAKKTPLQNVKEPPPFQNDISDTITTVDVKGKESTKESVSVLESLETKTIVTIPEDSTVPSEPKRVENIPIDAKEIPINNVSELIARQNDISESVSNVESSGTTTAVLVPIDSIVSSEIKAEESTPVESKESPFEIMVATPALQNYISDTITTSDIKKEKCPKEYESLAKNSETKIHNIILGYSTISSETAVEGNTPVEVKGTALLNTTEPATPQNDVSERTAMGHTTPKESPKESLSVIHNLEIKAHVLITANSSDSSETTAERNAPVEVKETSLENAKDSAPNQNYTFKTTTTGDCKAEQFPHESVPVVDNSGNETVSISEKVIVTSQIAVEDSALVEAKETLSENATNAAIENVTTDNVRSEESPKESVSVVERTETKTPVRILEDNASPSENKVEESTPEEAKGTPFENATEPGAIQNTTTDAVKAEVYPKESVPVTEGLETKTAVLIPRDSTDFSKSNVEEGIRVEAKETPLKNVTGRQNEISDTTSTNDTKANVSPKKSVSVVEYSETKTDVSIPEDSTAGSETIAEQSISVKAKEIQLENATEPAAPQNYNFDITTADDSEAEKSPEEVVETKVTIAIPRDINASSETNVLRSTPVEVKETPLENGTEPFPPEDNTTTTDDAKVKEYPKEPVQNVESSGTTAAVSIPANSTVLSETKVEAKYTLLKTGKEPPALQHDISVTSITVGGKAEESTKESVSGVESLATKTAVSISDTGFLKSKVEGSIPVDAKVPPLENVTKPAARQIDISDTAFIGNAKAEEPPKEFVSVTESSATTAAVSITEVSNVPSEIEAETSTLVNAKETSLVSVTEPAETQNNIFHVTNTDDTKAEVSPKIGIVPENSTVLSETEVAENILVEAIETTLENATKPVMPENDISDTTTDYGKAKESPKDVEKDSEIKITVTIQKDSNFPLETTVEGSISLAAKETPLEKATKPVARYSDISNTTIANDAKMEEYLKESGSIVEGSETSTSVSVPEDCTGASEIMVEKSTAVEAKKDLFESVTVTPAPENDVSDTTTTNDSKAKEFSKEIIESSETKVEESTSIQAKETLLENATEPSAPQNDISDNTIIDDAKAKETPKEVAESSETKTTVAIPQDGNAPSETKGEESTPIETKETSLQNATEPVAPQNNISDATATDDAKAEHFPKISVSVIESSETVISVSVPEDCTSPSETKVEDSTPIVVKETPFENVTATQNGISEEIITDAKAQEVIESLETKTTVAVPQDGNAPSETKIEQNAPGDAKETILENSVKPAVPQNNISCNTSTDDVKPEECLMEYVSVAASSEIKTTDTTLEYSAISLKTVKEENTPVEVKGILLDTTTKTAASQNDISDRTTAVDATSGEYPKESVTVIEKSESRITVSLTGDSTDPLETTVDGSTPVEAKKTLLEKATDSAATQNHTSDTTTGDDCKAKKSPKESASIVDSSENETAVSIQEIHTFLSKTEVEESTPVEAQVTLLEKVTERVESLKTKTPVSIPEDSTVSLETKAEENKPVEAKETPLENVTKPAAPQNNVNDNTTTDKAKADQSPKDCVSIVENSENKTIVSIPKDYIVPSEFKLEESTPVEVKETPLENVIQRAAPQSDTYNTTTTDEESPKESVSAIKCSETNTAHLAQEDSAVPSETKVEENTPIKAKETSIENVTELDESQNDISDTITADDTKVEESVKEVVERSKAKTIVSVPEYCTIISKIKVAKNNHGKAKEAPLENLTEQIALQNDTFDSTTTEKAKAEESPKVYVSTIESAEIEISVSNPDDNTFSPDSKIEKSSLVKAKGTQLKNASFPSESKEEENISLEKRENSSAEITETALKNATEPAEPQTDISDTTTGEAKAEEFPREGVASSEITIAVSIQEDSVGPSKTKVEESTPVEARKTPLENVTEPVTSQNNASGATATDDAKPDESSRETVEALEANTADLILEDNTIPSETKVENSTHVEAKETQFENATEPGAPQNNMSDWTTTRNARADVSPKECVSVLDYSKTKTATPVPEDITIPNIEENTIVEAKEAPLENVTEPAVPQNIVSDATAADDAKPGDSPKEIVETSETNAAESLPKDSTAASETKVEESSLIEAKETSCTVSGATATIDSTPDESPREVVETLEANTADLLPDDSTAPLETKLEKSTHVQAKETPLENATEPAVPQNNISDWTNMRGARAEVSPKESVSVVDCSKTKTAALVPKVITIPNIKENTIAEAKETPLENVTESAVPQNIVSDATATDYAKAEEYLKVGTLETNVANSIPKDSTVASETKIEESSPMEAKETPCTVSGATATDDSKPDVSPREVVEALETNTADSSAPSETKVDTSTHVKAKETTLENATEPVVPENDIFDTTTAVAANSEGSPKKATENSEAKTTVAVPQDNNAPSETKMEKSTPVEAKETSFENPSEPVVPPSDMSDTMDEIKAEVSPVDCVSIVKSSETNTAYSVIEDKRTEYTKTEESLKEFVEISETQTTVLITENSIAPAETKETLLGNVTEPTGSQNEVYDTRTTNNAKTVESPMKAEESSGTKPAISVLEDNTSFSESKGKESIPVNGKEASLIDVTEYTVPLNAISDTIAAASSKSEQSPKVVVPIVENSKNETAVSISKEYNASSENPEKANSVAEERVCPLENVAEPIVLQNNIFGKTAADDARSENSRKESISDATFLETKTVVSIQKGCTAPSETTIKRTVVIESSETKVDVSISKDSTCPLKTAIEEVRQAVEGNKSPVETVESQKAVSEATSNDYGKSEECGEKSLLATEYSNVKTDIQIIEPIIFSDEIDIKKAITAVEQNENPSKELKLAASVNFVSKTTTNDNAKSEVPSEKSISAVGSSEIITNIKVPEGSSFNSETTVEEDSVVVEGKETQLENVRQLITLPNIIPQETTKDNVAVIEVDRTPLENLLIMETKRQLRSNNIQITNKNTSDLENQTNIQIAEKISTLEIETDSQPRKETPIVEPTIVTMETKALTGNGPDASNPPEDAQNTSIFSEDIQNWIYKENKVDAITDKLCQGTCDTKAKDLNESTIILSATKILENNIDAQQSKVNSTILQASSAKQETPAVICETVQKSESSKRTDVFNDKISENDITTNEIPEQIDPNINQIENCEITEPPATDRSSLESNTTDGSSTTVIERSETSPEPLLSNDKIEAITNKSISAITNHTNTAPNSILNTNAPSSDILIKSDVEKDALPKPTLGEDEIERPLKHLIPGSIAEREHKKWYNAVEMPNNPYAPEALIRRLSDGPEKPIDIPNITPVLEKTNEDVEKVCENPLPVGLEVEKPDYKRYSRDYYINDAKHASGSRIFSSKSSEINLIGQACAAGSDKEPTTSTTTPPPYSQQLVSSNCRTDKKTDNFGDIFLAKPVRVEESDPILNKATKLEYLSTPDRDFYLLPSDEAGNLRRSTTPSDHTSTQTIDSVTTSEDSDTIRIYDLNKQETRLIKDETLETSPNTPIRPTVLSLGAPKGPTPTRVVTPTSLRFLQPKRKLFDPKLIMSDDTDKSFTIMDGDVIQTPTNGLTEKPVIEQEVASSLPSVKALAKAYLLASSKASNVTLNRTKSPTFDHKTSLTSDVKTPTTPTSLISTLELSDDKTLITSTASGNELDQPQSPIIVPSSDSYSPPYDQKYSPISPTTNKSLNLEIVTNNTECENTMIESVLRPERPISPVVQPGQLRNSIAFFENLKNK